MRQFLTGADLFAHAMMLRGVDRRLILFLEGPDDCAVIDPHIHTEDLQSLPGYGKASVLDACQSVENRGITGIAGLVDADFDRARGLVDVYPSCVMVSEHYDLDMDLTFADPEAVVRLVHNFGDLDKLRAAPGRSDFLTLALDLAEPVGLYRYVSVEEGLGLKLAGFPFELLLERQAAGVDLTDAVHELLLTRHPGLDGDVVRETVAQHNDDVAREQLINGHDLCRALSALVRKKWGGALGADTCEKVLRSSSNCHAFALLRVYRDVADWAAAQACTAWSCPVQAA